MQDLIRQSLRMIVTLKGYALYTYGNSYHYDDKYFYQFGTVRSTISVPFISVLLQASYRKRS